jgi:hypothetical protein
MREIKKATSIFVAKDGSVPNEFTPKINAMVVV